MVSLNKLFSISQNFILQEKVIKYLSKIYLIIVIQTVMTVVLIQNIFNPKILSRRDNCSSFAITLGLMKILSKIGTLLTVQMYSFSAIIITQHSLKMNHKKIAKILCLDLVAKGGSAMIGRQNANVNIFALLLKITAPICGVSLNHLRSCAHIA